MSTQTANSGVIGGGNSFTHRGKSYVLGKVGLSELRELETFLRREPLEVYLPILKDMDAASREILIREAVATGNKRFIGSAEFNTMAQSLTGVNYLMWLSLRGAQPTLSRKAVEDLFSELLEDGLGEDVKARLFQAAGFETPGKKDEATSTKTATMGS